MATLYLKNIQNIPILGNKRKNTGNDKGKIIKKIKLM
jgi:hypothetical protein